jgi:dethiobiotin synthase
MLNRFFITGTDTGVGKTVVSALLCAALEATYWKPIQTGSSEDTDRATVTRLARLPEDRWIPETYIFSPPVSPHLAARLAGVRIDLRKIRLPKIAGTESLIVEGAGGVLVPINGKQLATDLMRRLGLPVLLVGRSGLGTINHTLLSLAALRVAKLQVHGVVMVGPPDKENRAAIEHYGKVKVVGVVPQLAKLDRAALVRVFKKHFDRGSFG